MTRLYEVGKLVDDDVFKAFGRQLRQLKVEPYAPGARIACAPSRPHTANAPFDGLHLHPFSPRRNYPRQQGRQLFAIPHLHVPTPILDARPRVCVQFENAPVKQMNTTFRAIGNHAQFNIGPTETMRFTSDKFEHRHRSRLREPRLSSLYPVDSCDNCVLDVPRRSASRGGHAYLPTSMYADGQVSHTLVRNGRLDAGRVDAVLTQREESFCEGHQLIQ